MKVRALVVGLVGCMAAPVWAQEAMYTAAATMPGVGNFVLREQVHFFRYGGSVFQNVERTDVVQAETSLQYGLYKDWSVTLTAPVEHRDRPLIGGGDDDSSGLENVDLSFKWRFYREDTGGIDTSRFALLGGARVRTQGEANVDPHLGIVWTKVIGRHGIDLELHYTLTTGGTEDRLENLGGEGAADAFEYNAAYVYRIEPAAYTSDSTGAWYVTAEFNGLYETNGDHEIRFAPGLMYEGRRWGFEVMAQVPVWSHVEERGALRWGIGVGVRFLF